MGTFTRDNTDLAVDLDGVGQQHRAEAGGMTIALDGGTPDSTPPRCSPTSPAVPARSPTGATPEGHRHDAVHRRAAEALGRPRVPHPPRPQRAHRRRRRVRRVHPADQAPGINTLELEPSRHREGV